MKKLLGFIVAIFAIAAHAQPADQGMAQLEKMIEEHLIKSSDPHVHAMRAPDDTVDNARKRINSWIRYNFKLSFEAKANGDYAKAFFHFVTARHTLRDATLPAANDANGDPAIFRAEAPINHTQISTRSWKDKIDQDTRIMFKNNSVPQGDLLRMYGIDAEQGPINRPNQLPRPNLAAADQSPNATSQEALQITTQGDNYELTAPVSQLAMTLPKSNLRKMPGMASNNSHPRYFYFEDAVSKLLVSGWFEPAQRFKGVRENWEKDRAEIAKRPELPQAQNVAFETLGKWELVTYELQLPAANAKSYHLRAHWVEAGTWIDVHLSLTTDKPGSEAKTSLIGFLKTIQVRQKS